MARTYASFPNEAVACCEHMVADDNVKRIDGLNLVENMRKVIAAQWNHGVLSQNGDVSASALIVVNSPWKHVWAPNKAS